nr:MAG TPA: hypothetical protein [Caudoviricetes sp.]
MHFQLLYSFRTSLLTSFLLYLYNTQRFLLCQHLFNKFLVIFS